MFGSPAPANTGRHHSRFRRGARFAAKKIHAVDYRDPTGVTMQPLWRRSRHHSVSPLSEKRGGWRASSRARNLRSAPAPFKRRSYRNRVNTWLREADDPRLNSIVSNSFAFSGGYMAEECREIVFGRCEKNLSPVATRCRNTAPSNVLLVGYRSSRWRD